MNFRIADSYCDVYFADGFLKDNAGCRAEGLDDRFTFTAASGSNNVVAGVAAGLAGIDCYSCSS